MNVVASQRCNDRLELAGDSQLFLGSGSLMSLGFDPQPLTSRAFHALTTAMVCVPAPV